MSAYAACLSVCLLLGPTVPPPADNPAPGPQASGRYAGYSRGARSPASDLLFRREAARAQQRAARIEARKWQGRSTLRPTIASGPAYLFEPYVPAYPTWNAPPMRVSFHMPLW